MNKWKKNKTYIYYAPEFDEVYLATYKPTGEFNLQNEPWVSIKEFDGNLSRTNFNPDVILLYQHPKNPYKFGYKVDTVYIGEL